MTESTLPTANSQPKPAEKRTKLSDEKFCGDCGSVIKIRAELCPKCGVRQHGRSSFSDSPNGRNRLSAALLAAFLGLFGVHRFYLGQIGLGFLYLIFFWTFIPLIVSIIDFVILCVMTDQEFAKRYGNPDRP